METPNGYRTKQRDLILSCIAETGGKHFTAEDLAEKLDARQCHVGRATVYRCLDRLLAEGVIRKYTLDGKSGACYQYAAGTCAGEHFHLKCVSCGRLFHADCTFLNRLAAHIRDEHDFAVDPTRTVFYGTCSACGAAKKSFADTEMPKNG